MNNRRMTYKKLFLSGEYVCPFCKGTDIWTQDAPEQFGVDISVNWYCDECDNTWRVEYKPHEVTK